MTSQSDRVAQLVRMLRQQHGINRDQLAAACREAGSQRMSAATITNIETGRPSKDGVRRRAVTVDELVVFAAVFSVAPADLLTDPCGVCHGAPPPGFTCNPCGTTASATPATGSRP